MAKHEDFTRTVNEIARDANPPVDPGTVRTYCDSGLIECRRLGNGTRLMKPSAAKQVERILAEHLARRGKHPR